MNSVEKIKQKLDMELFVRVAQEQSERRDRAKIIPFPSSKIREEEQNVDLRQSQKMFSGAKTMQLLWDALQKAKTPERAKRGHRVLPNVSQTHRKVQREL